MSIINLKTAIEEVLRLNQAVSKISPLSSGNVSIKLNNGLIVIKPSGVPYEKLTKKDISVVNTKGILLSGKHPSSDLNLHIKIYEEFGSVNSIIHAHSHYVTVMAILGKDLDVISTMQADYFGTKIPCLKFANHRTNAIYESIHKNYKRIKITNAFLLGKHGAFIFSDEPSLNLDKAFALEEIAKLNYQSLLISKRIKSIKEKDIRLMHNYYMNKYGQK
jgi:L-ribulose-5-phosphate 4-epimerase